MSKTQMEFKPVCFSTNNSTLSSLSIMRQYIQEAECLDIKIKDNQITFKRNLSIWKGKGTKIECSNSYYEITSLSISNDICENADCFIIFFDLEFSESMSELNKILNFISETVDVDITIYLIKLFTVENDIISNYTDNNIKKIFSNCALENYVISKVNMDSLDELAKSIDSITQKILQDKNNLYTDDYNKDNSTSNCLII